MIPHPFSSQPATTAPPPGGPAHDQFPPRAVRLDGSDHQHDPMDLQQRLRDRHGDVAPHTPGDHGAEPTCPPSDALPRRLHAAIHAWNTGRQCPPAALSVPWDLLCSPGGREGDQVVAALRQFTCGEGIVPVAWCAGYLFWLIPSRTPPRWSAPDATRYRVDAERTRDAGAETAPVPMPRWWWVEEPDDCTDPAVVRGRLVLLRAVLFNAATPSSRTPPAGAGPR